MNRQSLGESIQDTHIANTSHTETMSFRRLQDQLQLLETTLGVERQNLSLIDELSN